MNRFIDIFRQRLWTREVVASGLQLQAPVDAKTVAHSSVSVSSNRGRRHQVSLEPNTSPGSQKSEHEIEGNESRRHQPQSSAHQREQQMAVEAIKRRLQRLHRILPKVIPCKTCKKLTCQQEPFCHENRVRIERER